MAAGDARGRCEAHAVVVSQLQAQLKASAEEKRSCKSCSGTRAAAKDEASKQQAADGGSGGADAGALSAAESALSRPLHVGTPPRGKAGRG